MAFAAGSALFQDGDACGHYFLLLEGCIRVQKVSESGREIVLYRVEPGQACVLTTTCLLAGQRYPAEGVAEGDSRGLLLPQAHFQVGMAESPAFRRFVLDGYAQRLSELILLVQGLAFGRLDVRLAEYLLRHGRDTRCLAATHQAIAAELGTVREVVSRQLKEFERHGWVRLQRGQVELVDRRALRSFAGSGAAEA
jgi:CRP/FNR family transcriptional regulator